jgi:hypothetical protein
LKWLQQTGEEGEENEEADDNQDGKVVTTTTMAKKLKPISLIVVMLDVSMPSQ